MTHCASDQLSRPEVKDVLAQFKRLRMPGAAAVFEARCKEPDFCQLDAVSQFYEILQAEIARRGQNYYVRGRRDAGLVSMATAADIMPRRIVYGLNASMVRLLTTGEWREKVRRIVIVGSTGCGKTDLACAIVDAALAHHIKCLYRDYSLVMMDLTQAYAGGDPELYKQALRRYAFSGVLALDDVCNGLPRKGEPQVFKDLLDTCMTKATNLILVSQKTVKQWHEFLGGGTEADAVLDRVMSQQLVVTVTGASKRSGKPVSVDESRPGIQGQKGGDQ